jgi:CubicO group peptidase (beta-lactamase class C family)
MTTTVLNPVKAFTLIALGLAIGAMGFYVAEADDAPGAAGMGLVLMVTGVVLGVRAARNRLPTWAARTALAGGLVFTVLAALLTRGVVAAAPLFPQAQAVPSVTGSAPPPQYTGAVERAREFVRAAVAEQNLPGISVAVGAGDAVVWAEGFGWRDVGTRTPVTPETRFHIGTAASAVTASVAPLGLAHTGSDAAKEWSPEAIGEEGEDFPPFTLIRHLILQPLGLAPAEYPLPGDRATFYMPRFDNNPRRGQRLMYMRDLACCANGMAFSSTPSDLVRVALATRPGTIDGALAGGTVTSIATGPGGGIVVAVSSNIAYANTSGLARQVGDAFAAETR